MLIIRRSNCTVQHLVTSHSVGGRPVRTGPGLQLRRVKVSEVDRDSSVGIATRYGLDGPGIECR